MPGPYVQFATVCEKVLREFDGTLSIIRAVDRIIVTVEGTDAPPELPEGRLALTLAVSLKADDAQGRYPVTIALQQPSGVYLDPEEIDAMFEGGERGVNLILGFAIENVLEGLYWFDVKVNERLLSRVPLRVIYQPVRGSLG